MDPATACKIAAGEVIERPASAVKELLDNSLDAGATRVDIEIEGGGKRLIRVSDNGSGMDRDDAALAFSRHATSKIRRAEDLFSVATLGFRGEALASIAAVASVELRTSTQGCPAGTLIRISPGGIPSALECAATEGTSITVSGLFSSLPARLRFLKSDAAEAARITEVTYSAALCNPGVSFSLKIDGDYVLRTQGTGSLGDVVASLFGVALMGDMLPIQQPADALGGPPQASAVRLSGFAGKPAACRSSRAAQYVFVNGRHIRSYAVRGAAEEAYRGLIHGRRFPVFFLNISLPFEWVDVNIHPQKAEVKFLRERDVTSAVYSAIRRAIVGGGVAEPRMASRVHDAREGYDDTAEGVGAAYSVAAAPDIASLLGVFSPFPGGAGAPSTSPYSQGEASLRDLRIIGQAFDSYLVAEGRNGLVLVDQHAAHERVCYERLIAARGRNAIQPLLSPQIMEMAPRDFERALDTLDILGELGFDVESFGNNTLLIRGIPAGLDSGISSEMITAVTGAASSAPRGSNAIELAAAALSACHSAVRAGRRLTPTEMTALVADLSASADPLRCPHGRPVLVEIGIEEIEKRFGRR